MGIRAKFHVWVLAIAPLVAGCSTSRAIDEDAGPRPPAADLDPVGTWITCNRVWAFGADGRTTLENVELGCTASGTWSSDGSQLAITWDAAGCGVDPATPYLATGLRVEGSLSLVVAGTSVPQTYLAPDAVELQVLRFTDAADPTRRTIARVIRVPGEDGRGCYWAEDHGCGGLFSCTGTVLQWREAADGSIVASTGCRGDCPCGAVIDAVPSASGWDATFEGVNCEGTFAGSATITTVPE